MATVKLDPAKGIQIPNLTTTERNAISSPETGAIIWNTTTSEINQYNGSAWEITYTDTNTQIAGITSSADATAITIDSSENTTFNGEIKVGTSDNGKITSTFALTLDPPTGEPIVFRTAGTDIARFRPGGGLCFGTDTAAANALDDYEEGTWTPALTGDSTAGNTSYTSAATQGIYTKVGRLVTASFTISLTAKGTINGNILINLPFTPTGFVSGQMHGQSGFCSQVKNMSTTTQGVVWRIRHDAASAYMQPIKSGTSPADSYGTHSDLSDSTKLVGTLTYASN